MGAIEGGGTDGGGTDGASDVTAGDPPVEDVVLACPATISFTGSAQTTLRGMQTNLNPATDVCPPDQLVMGYWLDPDIGNGLVGKLSTLCGIVSIDATRCSVTVSPGATLPVHGTQTSNAPVTQLCPSNEVVVGIRARSGADIDQAAFGCAPLTLVPSGSSYQLSWGAVSWFNPVGGSGGVASEDECPVGQVAIGSYTNSSIWIEAFALVCATPELRP
jgi:hypothetical protein